MKKNFKVLIPALLPKNKKQLSTEEANESRLCTKQRWVVESVNSSLKRFKFFKHTIASEYVPQLFEDFKIAAAIHNVYFRRMYSDHDEPEVASLILTNLNTPNIMQNIVEQEGLARKIKNFETMSSQHYNDFPAWTLQNLKQFTGTYQLSLARSYIADHLFAGKYEFLVSKENYLPNFQTYNLNIQSPIFIKAKLQSRHSAHKVYCIFILIDTALSVPESVVSYYC